MVLECDFDFEGVNVGEGAIGKDLMLHSLVMADATCNYVEPAMSLTDGRILSHRFTCMLSRKRNVVFLHTIIIRWRNRSPREA